MKVLLASLGLLLCSAAPDALAVKKTAIDSRLDSCLVKATTTADMIRCNNTAYSEWDKELNRVYRSLMAGMSASEKASLRTSQRAWLAFRDSEFVAIDSIYNQLDGTMYLPMRVASRTNIVRDRVIQLFGYQHLRSS